MRPDRLSTFFAATLLAAATMTCATGAARAHPHVWIENVATFQFNAGKIKAIRLKWTFDELFGAGLVDQFDKNKDKKFDAAELAALQKGAFDNLREYNYFTHVTIDSTDLPTRTVTGFAASVENGRLVYEFTVPLAEPVDPRRARLVLGVYDPSYFVELETGVRAGVRYEGNDGIACRTESRENQAKAIYSGQVFPLELHLTCTAAS